MTTTTDISARPRHAVPIRTAAIVVAVIGGLVGCGSDDDADATPAPAGSEAPTGTSAETETESEAPAPAPAAGSGTLTMADGTVYALVMSTCETSENGAEGFVLPESYDLFGRTADNAFRVQLIRAGLDEEFVSQAAALEGDFDENGVNAGLLYSYVRDTLALTVDGGNVSGTVTLKAIELDRPHGDEMDATVDVRC